MPTCLRSRSAKVVRQWIVQKCFQPNSANTCNMQPAHSFSGGCEVFHGFIFRSCSFRNWKFNHFRSPPTRAMFRAFPMFDRKVDGWNSVLVIKTKQPDLATWTACLNVFTGLFFEIGMFEFAVVLGLVCVTYVGSGSQHVHTWKDYTNRSRV